MVTNIQINNLNTRDMKEVCEVRKVCKLSCKQCIFYEVCDGNGNIRKEILRNGKSINK